MGKVVDTTNYVDSRYLLSQTPPNFVKDNYFLHELAEKVDAEWEYRPNRADIEQEESIGSEKFFPIQVVMQSVRNDKGTKVSNDWRRLVFRDIRYEARLGTKFRFAINGDPNIPAEEKSIWLGVNLDSISPTSQIVVVRCNGTIGSVWFDEQGVKNYHYEPVVQSTTLTSTSPSFNDIAIDPKSQLIITCQHNKYTKEYYINQRFIIGYDRVYKISNIIKTDSLQTYNSLDVGVMTIYLDFDQNSAKDDFINRIAYNGRDEDTTSPEITPPSQDVDGYEIRVVSPNPLPNSLYSDSDNAPFEVWVYQNDNKTNIPVDVKVSAVSNGETIEDETVFNSYCAFDDSNLSTKHQFTLKRIMKSWSIKILVHCFAQVEDNTIECDFELSLWGVE